MANETFTILDELRATNVPASITGDQVRLAPDAVKTSLGWELKPEGLCQGDTCIPARGLASDGGLELTQLAAALGRPLALDAGARMACFGAPADERAAQLKSLKAPDFTLPDLHGVPHSLSDYRGQKVLLVAYASW